MSESSDTAPEEKPRLVESKERGIVVGGARLATAMNDAPRALYARAPLVVLPDIGFVWQDYLSLLERHASQRRVFALDWPGFGSSERAPSQGHLPGDEHLAQTLAAWMDSLGIGRAVFLSTGVSGMVAIRYAAAHPRRTLGLGLIAPVGFYPGGVTSRLGMRVLRTPLLMRRLDGYVTSLLVGPAVTAEAERVLERHRQLRQSRPATGSPYRPLRRFGARCRPPTRTSSPWQRRSEFRPWCCEAPSIRWSPTPKLARPPPLSRD